MHWCFKEPKCQNAVLSCIKTFDHIATLQKTTKSEVTSGFCLLFTFDVFITSRKRTALG